MSFVSVRHSSVPPLRRQHGPEAVRVRAPDPGRLPGFRRGAADGGRRRRAPQRRARRRRARRVRPEAQASREPCDYHPAGRRSTRLRLRGGLRRRSARAWVLRVLPASLATRGGAPRRRRRDGGELAGRRPHETSRPRQRETR